MDSNKIDELLNKYWNCETSLEEEQQLREYFRGEQIPEQWKETATLFRYFDTHKKKTLNDGAFDTALMKKINTPPPSKGKVVRIFYNTLRIAAGVSVLVVATFLVRNEIRESTPQEMVDTYDDPKLALEETKKALMMISKSFGTAEEKAKKINMFNEAQQQIQKNEEKRAL
ncbi:hypothetical protein KK083_21180 [Fulvivirgaceae bacterium PWU4]|uniref:Uncharacterized protein n=1 Tax=Chryseosolibacter histidini TaxID=2782349 RepID=A0AAP2DPY8_9BACT|nr:hypothetical protein [Chryseosolibacter histidini]MBT1699424.1 hypothetical protein [Chryseosolibacter histidini]